jgi:1-acyl-sn-glycerol-3-phosphate acyltransferase
VSKNSLDKSNNLIYLSNHRSWSDLFIDQEVSGYKSLFISRMMVLLGIPLIGICSYVNNTVFYFNKNGKNLESLFSNITKALSQRVSKRLLVYPEGTRRITNEPCDLKKGFIYYAYDNKIPVQIAMTKNKEVVFSEKLMRSNRNVTLYTYYGDTIKPETYESKENFYKDVQVQWNIIWNKLYFNTYENSEELVMECPPAEMPYYTRFNMIYSLSLVTGILFGFYKLLF